MIKQAQQSPTISEGLQSLYEAHVLLVAIAKLDVLSYSASGLKAAWVPYIQECEINSTSY